MKYLLKNKKAYKLYEKDKKDKALELIKKLLQKNLRKEADNSLRWVL